MRDLVLADRNAPLVLALLKSYDGYTYNHSVNVAIFALAFGRHAEIRGEALERVGLAGLLHDLGKVRTAEAIIKKPGALTPDEMVAMRRHPELGAEILQEMRDAATTQRFIDMIGAYPVGDVVRLSTDELAVVSRVSDLDATAPFVRIVADRDGALLAEPVDCDLAAEPAGGRVIADSVDPLRKGIDVARVLGF